MTVEEVCAIMDALDEEYKEQWEQVRYISTVVAASQGSKLNLKFAWDAPEPQASPEELLKSQYDLIHAMMNPNKQEFKPV